jgi:homoserine/homoserine lactone efflux protein
MALLYFATWLLVALTPGPAVLCSMSQSVRHGFRASMAGVSGIQTGNFIFFVCVALGLGTLLAQAATAFAVLKVIGAVYLVYLGCRMLASSFKKKTGAGAEQNVLPMPHGSLFLQGVLVQLTNPKALLFVSALLPQFIETGRPIVLQLAVLVCITIAVDTLVLGTYGYLARRGAEQFRRSWVSSWLERLFGVALVVFGVRLVIAKK